MILWEDRRIAGEIPCITASPMLVAKDSNPESTTRGVRDGIGGACSTRHGPSGGVDRFGGVANGGF